MNATNRWFFDGLSSIVIVPAGGKVYAVGKKLKIGLYATDKFE